MNAENMIRCPRCHTVFDANLGPCFKCGAPYQPRVTAPPPPPDSFVDRYSNTDFVAPVDAPVLKPMKRSGRTGLLIGSGVALIAVSLIVVLMATMGSFGTPAATPRPMVVGATERPTPTPTLPPTVNLTLQQLNDPSLSAHLVIDSRMQIDARVNGTPGVQTAGFEGNVSGRDEAGVYRHNGVSKDFRYVGGNVYGRVLPNGKWAQEASLPTYLILTPMFNITSPQMLQVIGEETKGGQKLLHLQSTQWWLADKSRLAIMDTNMTTLVAENLVLDLWVTSTGTPSYATFSANTKAIDGTKLLDIEVTYTFTNVGMPVSIGTPEPTASPTKK